MITDSLDTKLYKGLSGYIAADWYKYYLKKNCSVNIIAIAIINCYLHTKGRLKYGLVFWPLLHCDIILLFLRIYFMQQIEWILNLK